MRITNKIMQRNNLANINTNKIYQDQLSTQMSTQKKIARASDDPVVAIRALRLRSNVTEVTQYYSKNIPDAKSWLEITEDALKNQSQVMTDMISQATKGANGDLTSKDRGIILEQLQALGDEVYSTANADYAGRYVFTGFRTDTPLSFLAAKEQTYEIKEQLDRNAISTLTKVESGNVLDWTAENYDTLKKANEQSVEAVEVYRLQLAYKDCSENVEPRVLIRNADGEARGQDCTIMHSYENDPSPYKAASMDDDAMIYIPETGEILLGKNNYQFLMQVKDDISTTENEGEIQVVYRKDSWKTGDLRPEHYFCCKSDPDTENEIEYNNSLAAGDNERYNQLLEDRANTREEADSIQSEYPSVNYISTNDYDTINKARREISELTDESNALLAESMEPGVSAARIDEINERLDEINEKVAALNAKIDSCYENEPDPNTDQLMVDDRHMSELDSEINSLNNDIWQLNREKASLESEATAMDSEYDTASAARKAEIDARRSAITNRISAIDNQVAGLREQLEPLVKERDDLQTFNEDWEKIQQLSDEITFMERSEDNQAIEYDVGFNQTIRVNSTAGECFQHGIGRTVDDLVSSLQEVSDLEEIKEKIKKALDDVSDDSADAKTLRAQYEAADKALTLAKDKNQKLFEKGITTFQKYLDDASLSITNCGNRSKKLELIENRMQSQKTTFETLKSENEDVDIAETAIQLTSAQLTYEAALMATGKVSQNSLLQYI